MHKSYQELGELLRSAEGQVSVGEMYRHYKDADSQYRVVGFTILEADDSIGVKYVDLAHADIEFTRPLASWLEVIDGSAMRFEPIK